MSEYPNFLKSKIQKYYKERVQETWSGGHIMKGKKTPNKQSILVNSNDYLSLGNNKEILEEDIKVKKELGNDIFMSAVFLQDNQENKQSIFEKNIANFMGFEDSVTLQSGFMANIGLLQTITDRDTPVYIDQYAHASLWLGIKMNNAKAIPFRHNNTEDLQKKITRFGSGIVVIDSLYSTWGTIAPIEEMVKIGKSNNCVIVVDESHSLGVFGETGEGLVKSLNLEEKVDFVTLSLAKAFCGRGGLISCSKKFKQYFIYEAFPVIFSSALLSHEYAAFNKTLEIIKGKDGNLKRKKLTKAYSKIHNFCKLHNIKIESDSQIIALEAGSEQKTIKLRDLLESHNIFAAPFCWPATPKNRAMMRISLHAELNDKDIQKICNTILISKQQGLLVE